MTMLASPDFSLKSLISGPEFQPEIDTPAHRFQTEISLDERRFQTEISHPGSLIDFWNYVVAQWVKAVPLRRFHTEIGVAGSLCPRDFSVKSSRSRPFGISPSGYSKLAASADFSVKSSMSMLLGRLLKLACAERVCSSSQVMTPHFHGVPNV